MASDLVASPSKRSRRRPRPTRCMLHIAQSAKNLALIHMSLDKRAEKIKQVESDQRTAAQRQRDRETLLRGEIDALLPSADVTLHAERTLLESHTVGRRSLAAEGRCSQRFGSAAGSGQRAYSSDRRERVDEHVVPRSRAPHELVTCRARSQQHPRQGSSSSSLGGLVLVDSVLAVHVRMCFFYSTRFESLARSESHNTATDPTHTRTHGSWEHSHQLVSLRPISLSHDDHPARCTHAQPRSGLGPPCLYPRVARTAYISKDPLITAVSARRCYRCQSSYTDYPAPPSPYSPSCRPS